MKSWMPGSAVVLTCLFLTNLGWAQPTRITIKDETPEAYRLNRERAERAQDRLERKKERKHELELAKITANKEIEIQRLATQARPVSRASGNNSQNRPNSRVQNVSRNSNNQRASFFNGGLYTGFSNPVFGGFGFGNFGFNAGFQGRGFNRGFQRRGFRNGGRRGFQRRGLRGGGRRGGVRRGFR